MKSKILLGVMMLSILSGCAYFQNTDNVKTDLYAAGYASAIIYVDREKPTEETKKNIADTIDFIVTNVSETNTISSYSKALIPIVNNYIDKSENIKESNKPIAKIAGVYVLSSIDGLLSNISTSNVPSNIGYVYVKQFSTGFKDGLNICDSCTEVKFIMSSGYNRASYIR